jgi:hypothetical protein
MQLDINNRLLTNVHGQQGRLQLLVDTHEEPVLFIVMHSESKSKTVSSSKTDGQGLALASIHGTRRKTETWQGKKESGSTAQEKAGQTRNARKSRKKTTRLIGASAIRKIG